MDIDENNGTLEEGGENNNVRGGAAQAVAGVQDINEDMLDETEQDDLNAQWGDH